VEDGEVEEEVGLLLAGLLDALLAGVEGAFAFCFCGHFGARFGVCDVLALAWVSLCRPMYMCGLVSGHEGQASFSGVSGW
jgi:hypothetical protein